MPDHIADPTNSGLGDELPEAGTGLCLSGGGYRAMLFHVGVLWRLHELGRLKTLKRISSVSGGSITAAVLGCAWSKIGKDLASGGGFVDHVVTPIRDLADRTLDAGAIMGGIFLPGTIGDRIADAYDDHLFGRATLQDLPDDTRFVINATNIQSGVLWRFSKPFMGDYRVGRILNPDLPLAKAVAASSAFPPVLSPVTIKLDPARFEPGSGYDLQRKPFTSRLVLSDGGVYDNLGLETVWKRYREVWVSDGGGKSQPEEEPHTDWPRHAYRVFDVIDNQVRSLRKRQIMAGFKERPGSTAKREGAYWGIRTDIARYSAPNALNCPQARTLKLAAVPTRLKRLDDELQERLINWGYAVTDAAYRTYVDRKAAYPSGFPYPKAEV
ncbi:MAG TPA: patatin-like phospholipase family protein [Allosphingosinicella sp.]|jgi:NTE family protein